MAKKFVAIIFNNGQVFGSYAGDTAEAAENLAAGAVKGLQSQGYSNLTFGSYELKKTGTVPPAVQINWSNA